MKISAIQKESPFFSVVLPTYNRAFIIKEAIDSIIHQNYTNWELIIIDDGSTDQTEKLVASLNHSQIKFYTLPKNKGQSVARNEGIKYSKGRYICFLDSDDFYLSNHFETLYSEIQRQHESWTIFRTGLLMGTNSPFKKQPLFDHHSGIHPILFFAKNFCSLNTLAIPREILLEHNFDPKFRAFQDTHLLLRLLALHPFIQIPHFTCVCREHTGRQAYINTYEAEPFRRINNNIEAIRDLFKNYSNILKPYIDTSLEQEMVCEKYINYANSALLARRFRLAIKLMINAWRNDPKLHFWLFYLKFFLKLPLKLAFNFPKSPLISPYAKKDFLY